MKSKFVISTLALLAATTAGAAGAAAVEQLTLYSSRTSYMQMAEPPGTVVVGNPSIADVTINGSQVFLHGRNYGSTNIMIFDTKGQLAREFEVVVQEGAQNHVTVFKGPGSLTFACAADCQPTMRPGDIHEWFNDVSSEFKKVTEMATGQKSSDGTDEVPAPPPAQ
jgi:Pilus formation protein N terminal region